MFSYNYDVKDDQYYIYVYLITMALFGFMSDFLAIPQIVSNSSRGAKQEGYK